jgi:hypothetical protein
MTALERLDEGHRKAGWMLEPGWGETCKRLKGGWREA